MTAEVTKLRNLSKRISENPEHDIETRYKKLIDSENEYWGKLEVPIYLQLTGTLINYSEDLDEVKGLERAIGLLKQLNQSDIPEHLAATRYYQLASGYSAKESFNSDSDSRYTFFESADLVDAIAYFRAAVSMEYVDHLPREKISKIYTDFANLLARLGRVVEALRWYDEALKLEPKHAMALGNRGNCKMEYGTLLFTDGHYPMFMHSAYKDLEKALENSGDLYPRAEQAFQGFNEELERFSDERLAVENNDEYEIGKSTWDKRYHEWVLKNGLYLNPLNDISAHSSVAHDYFHLPNMLLPENEDFPYPGIYNQVKQEYVTARYVFFEGVESEDEEGHFSDRDVKLPDTLDYAVYGYRTEQVKTALRLSYSIFDKIAEIINHYFDVGQSHPGFNEVWHKGGNYKQGLAEPFRDSNNWPLNALFWIKKDFHHRISERDEDSVITVAHELRSLRTMVEHDYMKVFHDDIVSSPSDRDSGVVKDSLFDAIGKNELRSATLEMLKLARAALIYLSLAIHHEEKRKRADIDGPAFPVAGETMIPDHLKE